MTTEKLRIHIYPS